MSDTIYKYTDLNGALRIISSQTLKFTRPSALNDPWDIYIDDFPGIDREKFRQKSVDIFFDMVTADPDKAAKLYGISLEQILAAKTMLESQSPEVLESGKELLKTVDFTKLDKGFSNADAELQKSRDIFIQTFNRQGVFCATKDPHNLLMWAHYADAHRGVVLGFTANRAKDSVLTLAQPVNYIKDRKELLATAEEIFEKGHDHEKLMNLYNKLIHTKSAEWEYEQEWRVSIPDAVVGAELARFMSYYPEELTEVYLGTRVSNADKRMLTIMAKILSSNVKVYSMSLTTGEYKLTPSLMV